jgi:hypothetical protein
LFGECRRARSVTAVDGGYRLIEQFVDRDMALGSIVHRIASAHWM